MPDSRPTFAARPTRITLIGFWVGATASAAAAGLVGWLTLQTIQGSSHFFEVLGRATGLTSYVLMLALVTMGLVLSHPWSRRLQRPSAATRVGLHIALATFTLAFTALHVVVAATEPGANMGWRDLLLPVASAHRPIPRTLGVLAVWSGLITGITARFAGRFAHRVWWPVHKGAIVVFILTWAHSVVAGSDTPALRWFYLATGVAVLGLAVTRYGARTPADRVDELSRAIEEIPTAPDFSTPRPIGAPR